MNYYKERNNLILRITFLKCLFYAKLCHKVISESFFLWIWSQKKQVLFPEIGRVKIYLSLTLPHKSNLYENVFLFQKNTHTNKNFQLAILFLRVYVFFPSKNKR